MQYWYCLDHNRVEEDDESCADARRLGPYPTHEEAENALARVEERNDEWDNDPDWNDPDDDWGDD